MKPAFAVLRGHYPKSATQGALFGEIGWTDLLNKPAYKDTCAIRVSVALVNCGISLPGARMRINAGQLKGRRIEPGQNKLSMILKRLWGNPETYNSEQAARDGIAGRSGVVSFFRIQDGPGGHIDLVSPSTGGVLECARSCYFSAARIWFWPLD